MPLDAKTWLESDPRNRPRPHVFWPPKDNRLICWLGKWLSPRNLRRRLKVVDVSVSDEDLARLRALRGERCLLMPSHSGGFEPFMIMDLSRRIGANFFYLAAIEAFERHPVLGWLMQRAGAYSVIRGTADRPSFQMTRRVLREARRWLVVFPEGQTVWQNDTVLPFQEGVTQLAFKGYEDALGDDADASLVCIPVAIKYVYLRDMQPEIDASLKRLEAHLFEPGSEHEERLTDRLLRIAEAVLAFNEEKHGVQPDPAADLNGRIQTMKELVVREVEGQLRLAPREEQSLIDRIRACFNAVDAVVNAESEARPYAEKLMGERRKAASDLYEDLWRVLQFVAIYEDYVNELMTVERFMDVLCLLEMEVLGERRVWGPRRAILRVGEAVDLRNHLAAYREKKRETVRTVSAGLEASVRGMLQAMASQHSMPLESEKEGANKGLH